MTPARAQLESIVDAQRRKQLVATLIAALVETLFVAALLFALFRLGLPNLTLSRPRRLAMVLLVAIAFVMAVMIEQRRQSRSTLFWAKRIDDANALEDHLVTALSFSDPVTDGFEQACLNALVQKVYVTQLRLPDVRLERLWLLMPAVLLAAATGLVDYARRTRPKDDGRAIVTLPQSFADRAKLLGGDEGTAARADARLRQQAREARQMFAELAGKSLSKEAILSRVSAESQKLDAFDRQNPSMIASALQLGDPSSQRARSLVSGVRAGQPDSVSAALDTIEKALSGQIPPPLSTEEREELKSVLRELAKAAANPELAQQLQQASDAVGDPARNQDAVQAIESLKRPLAEQLSNEQATQLLAKSLRAFLASTRREADRQTRDLLPNQAQAGASANSADGGGLPALGTTQNPEDRAAVGEEESEASGGAGAGAAGNREYTGGTPEEAATTKDAHVSSPWVGASITQTVTAASNGDKDAQAAVRVQLGNQQRVAEREVQREEIPAEYAGAIRRYFSNLQQDWDRQWKPSK